MTQAVWLVLPDPFSSRLFFDTGIVDRLQSRVDDGLSLVLDEGERAWAERSPQYRGPALPRRTPMIWTTLLRSLKSMTLRSSHFRWAPTRTRFADRRWGEC